MTTNSQTHASGRDNAMTHHASKATRAGALVALVVAVCALGLPPSAQAQSSFAAYQSAYYGSQARPAVTHGQSATLLGDGRWLLLGGETTDHMPIATAIIVDSSTGQRNTLADAMTRARSGHTATVMPDGSVLILGGEGVDGRIVAIAESFDPRSGTFQSVTSLDLVARQFHTATLLTDGRLLIVGGVDDAGRVIADVELFDVRTGGVERFDAGIETARFGHLAALLPSAPVLIWGGLDSTNQPAAGAELFEPQVRTFSPRDSRTSGYLPGVNAGAATPAVTGVHPDPATDIAVDSILTLRFSKSIDVTSLGTNTVTLFGPGGATNARVVAAEAGMLLFVTPERALNPGAYYTLFVNGAKDATGLALPFTALQFHTQTVRAGGGLDATTLSVPGDGRTSSGTGGATSDAAAATLADTKTLSSVEDDDMWIPGAAALRGDWRSKRVAEVPQLKALAAVKDLSPAGGQTAVTGQVLRLNGRPLVGATVSMNGRSVRTALDGRFMLVDVQPGWQRLSVDGTTANRIDAQYGRHDMRVYVTAGKTNPLVWTVWVSRLDIAHAVRLDSPTQRETIVSTPYIPGLEFRIPAGTVVRDRDGRIVTELTITPIPLDQTSHPLPEGGFPVYFTLQPSGVRFESADGTRIQPVRLRYPNIDTLLKPGSPANFWSYDPDEDGWKIYAQGRVTADNYIDMPAGDAYGFRSWEDGGHSGGPPPPSPGPPCNSCPCGGGGPPGGGGGGGGGGPPDGGPDGPGAGPAGSDEAGDPCSISSGQFTLVSTDLAVRDFMPFDVTRVYRPNDNRSLAFGIGTNWPFAMYVSGGEGLTSHPLVMANGSRIYFDNINNNTGHGGLFVNSTTPGPFFGAVLTIVGSPELFTILRRDGTLYTFDASGNLIEIRARTGAAITIVRDASNNISQITSPSGRWIAITRNASGFVSQIQDNGGRTVSYAYTSSRLSSVTNANGGVWSYTYDTNGRMQTVVDPRHNTMLTNAYDANGRIARQTYADGSLIQFAYTLDTNGNVAQADITDRNGSVRRVQLTATGDIQQEAYPLGAPEQQVVTYTRDAATHLLSSKTDALSRRTDYSYDGKGNLLSITRLAGTVNAVTTQYAYDPTFNQIAAVTDPLNHTTTLGYDIAGNLARVQDPLGHATTMTYDSQGELSTVTDPLNGQWSYTYDSGVMTGATDPLNRTTTIVSDTLGRIVQVTDPTGRQARFTYDPLDRATQVVDGLGNSATYEYDPNGNLTAHVDQNGNRMVYTYDAMNRMIARKDAALNSDLLAYDPSSMLNQVTDRMNQVIGLSYDSLHRRTRVGFGATPANPTAYTSTIDFSYDAGDRLTRAADSANGTIDRTYDGLDRLTREVTPTGTVDYAYDAAGRRATMTIPGQASVVYGYDNANRLTSIQQGSLSVGLAYDNANRRTRITLPNGVTIDQAYDAAGQLQGLTYKKGATTLGTLTYGYDNAGQQNSVGGTFARTDLPALLPGAVAGTGNRLAQWGARTLAYDANGNITSDGVYTYTWNARRQLVQVNAGSVVVASYQYDAFGRRKQKTISGVTTQFMYDGKNFVQERDGTGAVTANLLAGLDLDEIYARTKGANTSSYLIDHLGTIIAEADATGVIQTNYSYEPYGKTTQSGASSDSVQRFTAREQDTSDLYYYRGRYYSPTLDRFVSEDPIGLPGGLNLYTYVGDDPVSATDPLGLQRSIGRGRTPGRGRGRKHDDEPEYPDDWFHRPDDDCTFGCSYPPIHIPQPGIPWCYKVCDPPNSCMNPPADAHPLGDGCYIVCPKPPYASNGPRGGGGGGEGHH